MAPICLGLSLVGFGIGIAWPHIVTRVFQTAPAAEQDMAAGAVTTVQLFATALGAGAAGVVANLAGLTEPGGVIGAARAAHWLFAAFAVAPALGILVAWRVTSARR